MASVSLSFNEQDETAASPISKDAHGSENVSSLYSKKKSKPRKAALERKKEAKEKAEKVAKEKEQKAHHMYELWSQAKQEEKTEYFNYLKERVTLQHELIKQQDELFRKRKEKLEEKRNQIKEAKRLAKLARSTEYAEFVRDAIASDKLSTSKLKSHARVISSHQPPPRQPLPIHMETRRPSRDQIDSSSKQKEDRRVGDKWESQTKEFAELLDLPLDAQLNVLLGSTADSFLKPTFREGAKKTLDPVILKQPSLAMRNIGRIRKYLGQAECEKLVYAFVLSCLDSCNGILYGLPGHGRIGAKELWRIIRHSSWKKLEQQDARISQDVKNAYTSFMRQCLQRNVQPVMRSFCSDTNDILPTEDQVSESHLLEDVHFTRHRLDLMFRIAHVNRDKTRLLFRSLEAVNTEGPRMIPTDSQRSRLEDSLRLSKVVEEREDEEAEAGNEDVPKSIPTSRYNTSPAVMNKADRESSHKLEAEQAFPAKTATVGTEKIVFLTEDMARCQGEFSKRHKAPGSNNAVDTTQAKADIPRPNIKSRMTLSAPVATANMRTEQNKKVTSWEPLSLNALQEYKKSYDAPGSGTFRNGQTPRWNVIR